MDEILGLDANVSTAVTVIVTGVLVPALTAVLKYPGLGTTARRLIPIGLSAVGAAVIIVMQAGGPFAEQLVTWLLVLATLVGIAQAIYTAMPGAWKGLEIATNPGLAKAKREAAPLTPGEVPVHTRSDAERGQDATKPAQGHREPGTPARGTHRGVERPEDSAPFRYEGRTLNNPRERPDEYDR